MKLRIVPTALIAEDNAAVEATCDTAVPLSRSERFNTTNHARSEIENVVPESAIFTHEVPPWKPYGYTLFRPLIVRSQNMTSSHIFTIPSFLFHDMMLLHSSWLRTGTIPKSAVQDLIESWTCTKSGKALAALLDGRKRWFIRLDQMSPKDSPLGGHLPSSTLSDVITKVCSSMRAYGEYMDGHGRESGPKTQLILNPWNDKMDAATEFRVFVPPPAARGVAHSETTDFRVSGISQYKWHSPLSLPFDASVIWVADRVWKGARDMLASIAEYISPKLDADIENLLLQHGFTFDIALQENGSVHLVEINPFGAMSGCGACLFNWVLDGRMLYGLEELDVAIVLDGDLDRNM